MTLVKKLGEWGLLKRYLPGLSRGLPGWVKVGPGDDAAVVRPPPGYSCVVTTDMLVEGVHFNRAWASGETLGEKALSVNLSDLAAMGDVKPAFGVVSLGITPKISVDFVDSLYRGMRKNAKKWGFCLVGGDTVRADRVVISVTAVGWSKGVILRSGARPGDLILSTGTLGDAAAGMSILMRGKKASHSVSPPVRKHLVDRFLRPKPRLEMGQLLARGGVTSLMDSSDGLWRSVNLLCEASGTGARIWCERLPLSPAFRRWALATGTDPVPMVLNGGEDYELIGTAPPPLARRLERKGLATVVGEMTGRARGVAALQNQKPRRISGGFEHFA